MVKRVIAVGTAMALTVSALCSCASEPSRNTVQQKSDSAYETETAQPEPVEQQSVEDGTQAEEDDIDVTPCVEPYTVEPDLSNIDNLWQCDYLNDEQKAMLAENGFMVYGRNNEFFEIYESNRYDELASFVTVDSLMHTYHLYFSYLMKNVERDYLADSIKQLSEQMLDNSVRNYERLKGSEWESAAKRNVAYFNIALKLLDDSTDINSDVKDIVEYELDNIDKAQGTDRSWITDDLEDYSQYIPRGYYEGNETLEKYFKAMMWYGRIHFRQENEEMNRSACLMALTLSEDKNSYDLWKAVYDITSFFAGASDDLGVDDYMKVLWDVYGTDATTDTLLSDEGGFERFNSATGALPMPQINSIPIFEDDDTNIIRGFRFMGQRFTIDASIMQRLVYREVEENSNGEKRKMPDTLDVPAALGSDTALNILEDSGVSDYKNYSENMEKLRTYLSGDNSGLWSASLYSCWLDTLRPLLEVKGEGYPMFMQSEEWTKKDLECFAGSFAELKHDTILYSKQVVAEMGGGGWDQEPDDRGYVEPEPRIYAKFAQLSDRTLSGLKKYNMISKSDEENLTLLSQMADTLFEISEKELQDETLTDEEYEFIKSYGGSLEHFWTQTVKDETGGEYVYTQECPAATVADIATNPDAGTVLEVATGCPSDIFVIVKVDGKLKLARGSVYSFYQFEWQADDRLTDNKWRQMIGVSPDENGNYVSDEFVRKPEWTESYRYKYEWE